MDKLGLKAPTALKYILVSVGNFLLFIFYYYLTAFILGFLFGVMEVLHVIEDNHSVLGFIPRISLVITIILAVVLRRKIYLHLSKTV